jgi:hypothetical protein
MENRLSCFKSIDGVEFKLSTDQINQLAVLLKRDKNIKLNNYQYLYQPKYGVNAAITRRWSSSYHGIPSNSDVKTAFVPKEEDDIFLHADFAQNEYKVFAALAKEDAIVQAFREGKDIHMFIASKTFKKPEEEINSAERNVAKRLSFGLLYGKTVAAIADDYFNGDVPYAQKLFDDFYTMFPNIKVYIEQQKNVLFDTGGVTTVFGDFIPIVYDANKPSSVNESIRFAGNYPTQSSASSVAALVGYNFNKYSKENGLGVSIPGFIHDCLEGSFNVKSLIQVFDQMPNFAETWPYETFGLPMSIDMEIGVCGGAGLIEFKRAKGNKRFVVDGVLKAKFEGRKDYFNLLLDKVKKQYKVTIHDEETEVITGAWSDLYMRVASAFHLGMGRPIEFISGTIEISELS